MRGSANAYPVANVLHLLGLVMLVGGIGLVDLRVAGAFRNLPLRPLAAALTPIALAGFAILALTGPLLFSADATALVQSTVFRWKLALILVASANALLFRWLWRDRVEPVPAQLRLLAIGSISLWLSIAALGRMIAYR